MTECEIKPYHTSYKSVWDEFVRNSRNGTFLFLRDYMDYHADKFKDNSLMFYKKNKLIALLPAHINEDVFSSHSGLTYGGFIVDEHMTGSMMMELFELVQLYLKNNTSAKKWIYSPIPYIYICYPCEEDLYALFRNNAKIKERRISSVIMPSNTYGFSELRKRKVRKAKKNGLTITNNDECFDDFWQILEENLEKRYNTVPVHTLEEIKSLHNHFKENIQLYRVCDECKKKTLAGCVIYYTENVAHVQYIASTDEGKELGAVDLLFHYLINNKFKNIRYFDLGTSVEQGGKYLNEGLLFQKEGFGGRAVVYDTYEMEIK